MNKIEAYEVARAAQLAFILEPIPEKPGLTTRSKDMCEEVKLENFLIGGVNIGEAFRELATRLNEAKDSKTTLLPLTYDLCYKAQKDSLRGRTGCRLNYGGIITLFPIIITQCRLNTIDSIEILNGIGETLRMTSTLDTVWLQKMRNLAYEVTGYKRKDIFEISEDYDNIFDYYKKGLDNIKSVNKATNPYGHDCHTGRTNVELTTGYPYLKKMLILFESISKQNPSLTYTKRMEKLDQSMRMFYPHEAPVWFADLYTCLTYLLIIKDEDSLK